MFPAVRQLPRLQSLDLSFIKVPPTALLPAEPATPPDSSRLVSCCPGLQSLDLRQLGYSNTAALRTVAAPLAPLQHLSNLGTLLVSNARRGSIDQLEVVAQLTGLRELCLSVRQLTVKNLLLRLTHLKHLTRLEYEGPYGGVQIAMMFSSSGTRVRFEPSLLRGFPLTMLAYCRPVLAHCCIMPSVLLPASSWCWVVVLCYCTAHRLSSCLAVPCRLWPATL